MSDRVSDLVLVNAESLSKALLKFKCEHSKLPTFAVTKDKMAHLVKQRNAEIAGCVYCRAKTHLEEALADHFCST